MKLLLYTCMHKRQTTVKRCVELSPPIDRLVVYSEDGDGIFLKSLGIKGLQHPNQPLSEKWNYGLSQLRNEDFTHVVMMGSDDYFDQRFLDFIKKEAPKYDMIGFSDMYFLNQLSESYYWGGYQNERKGEPAGAGKVYSKEYLERINYDLFPVTRPRGLDGQSWVIVNHTKANYKIFSLKENKLWLCDIKDGQGVTSINKINGLVKCTQ